MKKSLLLSAGIVFLGVFLGRAAGFIREILLASHFGTSGVADIAIILLVLPDLFINVLVGGAVSAALVPTFHSRTRAGGNLIFWQASFLSLLLFSLLAIMIACFPAFFLSVLSPGLEYHLKVDASKFLSIVAWVIPLSALSAVTTAYLHAREQFLVPALGTLLFNGVVIFALQYYGSSDTALYHFSIGLVLGALFRWLSQLLRIEFTWPLTTNISALFDDGVLTRYFQALTAGGCILIFPMISIAIASYLATGTIATFNYVNKLLQLPMALGLSIFSVVLLPRVSLLVSLKSDNKLSKLIYQSASKLFAFSLIMSSVLVLFSKFVIVSVYSHGTIDSSALEQMRLMCILGLISVPAQAMNNFIVVIFNAKKQTKTPLLVNLFGLLVYTIASLELSHLFGAYGLMMAYTLSHFLLLGLYLSILVVKHGIHLYRVFFGFPVLCLSVFLVAIVLIYQRVQRVLTLSSFESMFVMALTLSILFLVNYLSDKELREYIQNSLRGR